MGLLAAGMAVFRVVVSHPVEAGVVLTTAWGAAVPQTVVSGLVVPSVAVASVGTALRWMLTR